MKFSNETRQEKADPKINLSKKKQEQAGRRNYR